MSVDTTEMTATEKSQDSLVEEWKTKGNTFYKGKEYKSAIEAYTSAIDLNDTNPSLYANRAAAQMMLLQFREAINDCNRSICLDSTVAKVYFRKACALKGLGDINAAIETYDLGLTLESNAESLKDKVALEKARSQIHSELKQLVARREYRKAIQIIDNLIRVVGTSYRDLNILKVESLVGLGKTEDAYNLTNSMLRNAIVIDCELLFFRAKCFYIMGDIENATKHLVKAMRSDPDNQLIRRFYRQVKDIEELKEQGNTAFKNGSYQESITFWTQAIDLDTMNKKVVSKLYSNRATAFYKLKKYDIAIEDCNKCLACEPNFIKALTRRAECNFALGGKEKLEKCLSDYEKLYDLETEEAGSSALKAKIKQIQVAIKRSNRKDHYHVLGVSPAADDDEIRKAYRKAALKHHPDKQAGKSESEKSISESAFKDVSSAYEILSDKEKRSRYDQGLDDEDGGSCSGSSGGGGHGHHGFDQEMLFQMFMQQQMGGSRGR